MRSIIRVEILRSGASNLFNMGLSFQRVYQTLTLVEMKSSSSDQPISNTECYGSAQTELNQTFKLRFDLKIE